MSINRPTLKKPVNKQSKNFEDNTQRINKQHGIKESEGNPFLNEVDVLLNEDEMSLKKKIFSLPKMEALVHSHPRLSEIYREMAADGEERYGYHYNETIMNIIFNDYILNDAELLQLYKKAKPKEKKRRDKSGIKKLQKDLGGSNGKDKVEKKDVADKKKEKDVSEGGISIDGLPAKGQEPAIHGGKIIDKGSGEGLSDKDKNLKQTKIKSVDKVSKPPKEKVDNKTHKIGVEETTTTGAVGGGEGAFGSGGYATPHAWSGKGDLMGGSEKDKKGKVLRKALRESDKNYLIDSTTFEDYYEKLNESFDSNVGDLMNEFMEKHIREEAKSKSQQKFMGMVRGVQKGDIDPSDVSKDVRKAAREMKSSDVKDFASTKHDDIPEKVNEHHKHTPEEQAEFIAQHTFGDSKYSDVNYLLNNLTPAQIKRVYDTIENKMGITTDKGIGRSLAGKAYASSMNEHHKDLDNPHELAEFIMHAYYYLNPQNKPDEGSLRMMIKDFANKDIEFLRKAYHTVENQLGEEGIAAVDKIISGINETEGSMISGSNQSMKFTPQPEGEQGSIPMGMQDGGGMHESYDEDDVPDYVDIDKENKIDWKRAKSIDTKPEVKDKFTNPVDGNELFEELNEELKAFSVHHNKLKNMTEDRRPSALVLKDRLGKDNQANFKSDMKDSATKDVVKMEKDMAWKEQQEEVGKNPYKAGEALEKESLKNTKGEALKNVGNSANKAGDEIPKRNLSDDEQEEVDKYRLDNKDLVYDNKPSDRFEERMKADLGDKLYNQRQKNMEFRGKAPMYNKEEQPVGDTKIDKAEFDKQKSGWNERDGLTESYVTGRYVDELGKKRLIDFQLQETKLISGDKLNENYTKLDFSGLGNIYDSRGNINESVDNTLNSHVFYTDGKNVVAIKPERKKLNEDKNKKKKQPVNEEFNKMKHLLGYNPKNYINTKNNKL
ncbi:MAG: DUF3008 family protein [bacterium]